MIAIIKVENRGFNALGGVQPLFLTVRIEAKVCADGGGGGVQPESINEVVFLAIKNGPKVNHFRAIFLSLQQYGDKNNNRNWNAQHE
ncbi:hypothetical protein [Cellvibrio sp. KY-YJ-3]|uniref:hypothetical protein n=1 Tax=Cellvibrio sp. KY-YJ-3 TaxID=454662 RepID=UPI0012453165|nr:hypothetical protein [Cellvibrio sp. KY-YJ-3]QEY14062.1 hypothetical protein D0B88_18420 [Cellvibrio sp. KY-YJ-3]